MYIAIYGRVSTEKQSTDGFGLDIQLKELITEAKENNQEYKEYIDQGITGTSITQRFGLKSMLDDVSKGIIKEVWVTKLSRLGRNTRDVLNIIYELEKNNVIFKSKRDGIDTSNQMGKIMLQFMSIVSEMERDIIIETTKAGLDYRASVGRIYGCRSIFGYDRIGSGKNSHLQINIEEAKNIKLIYNLYLKGNGYKAICNKLNRDGIKTKDGNYFAINTIKGILSNPLYVGKIRYNLFKDWTLKRRKGKQAKEDVILVDGIHKNIVSKVKWDRVQKKMKNNRATKYIQTDKYLITGLLRCPKCGSKMVGSKGRYKGKTGIVYYYYYECSNYKNKGKSVCDGSRIKANPLDKEVHAFLRTYFTFLSNLEDIRLFTEINDVLRTNDLLIIKRFMRILVKEIKYDFENRKISSIKYNIEEDLFEYLGLKYSVKMSNKVLRILNTRMIMD